MTHISRAVRFMSTLHDQVSSTTTPQNAMKQAVENTVLSPRHFPVVLGTSMMASMVAGYTYMGSSLRSSRYLPQNRRRSSSPHISANTVLATTLVLLALFLQPTPTTAFQPFPIRQQHQIERQATHINRHRHLNSGLYLQPSRRSNRMSDRRNDDNILQDVARHTVASIAAALVIFGATLTTPVLPSFAADMNTATTAPTTAVQARTQESLLTAPSAPSQTAVQEQDNVIEEVWNLISKYYIDSTFNNQDWTKVKQQALQEAKKYNFEDDNDKTMKIVTTMVNSLGDKYTRVLQKEQYAQIQKFDLIGVGVTLMPNAQKEIIVGAPPIDGSSAAKAGLQVGDLVTAVNGVPTFERNAFDIIDQISEQSSAKTVTFTILRKAQAENSLQSVGADTTAQTFDVTMDRQTMKVKDPVQYKLQDRKDGMKVGYIRISEFNALVNSKLQDALTALQEQGANAYVLDLRANTGGAFQSAVEISGMFLKDRVATYVVDRNQVELPFRTPKMQDLVIDPETPMVIWLDGMSASASEVLAGSLHDNCRAVTMGDNSFGKGLIQAVYGLKNGAGLVVTVAQYITPSGTEIQGKGIIPDIAGQMPAPVFIPGLSADTSKVDFKEISQRLDPNMCRVPEDRAPAKPATESIVNSS